MGIGGTGVSAIAVILLEMGHHVSGSDAVDSSVLAGLADRGIDVAVGHRAEHVGGAEVVAASTAIPAGNPELAAARQAGVPVLRRAELLAAICSARRTLAVAGTHGKSTTTAMLAAILEEAGLSPSWLVGAETPALGAAGRWADGDLFVVEADESDGTFLELEADSAIVTNIEADHLHHHGTVDKLYEAFSSFIEAVPGLVVLNADDAVTGALAGDRPGAVTFGAAPSATYRMADVQSDRGTSTFDLCRGTEVLDRISMPLPGRHNVANALAAATAALELGASVDAVGRALGRFGGVSRRWQVRGEVAGVTLVDDYSHLPTEVRAALSAARSGGWSRVVCVFQPHRYTRTESLWREFAEAFDEADVLAVTDVYSAGEEPVPGVTGKLIVDAVLTARPWKRLAWLPSRADLRTWLRSELRPGDLCLTLGAGDLTTLPDEVAADLAARA